MQASLDLGGSAAPDQDLHRLFFALWPDDATRTGIAATARGLADTHAPGGRVLGMQRYHLTLQFLGDFRPEPPPLLIEQARGAADTVHTPAFDLLLDRSGSFGPTGWLGCSRQPDGLASLWTGLGRALAREGVRVRSAKALTPHVTIVRDAARPLPAGDIPALRWPVASFVLIHSVLGRRSGYTVLGQWPLAGLSRFASTAF